MRRVGRNVVRMWLVVGALAMWPALAEAAPVAMCVPSGANAAITTPQADGTCPAGKAKRSLADEADLTAARTRISALEARLAGVTRTTVNGQPTIRLSGVNLQLVNGAGTTNTTNGRGNLIVGYNGSPGSQIGSHNVLVGRFHTARSWGSVLGGEQNTSTAPAQALFGYRNRASGTFATVSGGMLNWAEGRLSSISAGCDNAAGPHAGIGGYSECGQVEQGQSVSGGRFSVATGNYAAISGGHGGTASGQDSSISGGTNNSAEAWGAWVGGGELNEATASFTSVVGGVSNSAGGRDEPTGDYSTVVTGSNNTTEGMYSAVLTGENIFLTDAYTHFP